jgi:hypothetical protein
MRSDGEQHDAGGVGPGAGGGDRLHVARAGPGLSSGGAAADPETLRGLYGAIPARDFTRDVLQTATVPLSVLPVSPCGWSDLGVPERLQRFLGASPLPAAGGP